MALGDTNGAKNNNNESTYYSRIKFRSGDLSLGFSFWKGLLKVTISEAKQSYGGIEYNELIYIHLSPFKARQLAEILINFKGLSHKETRLFGIDTGMSDVRNIIAFGIDKTSTADEIKRYMVIGKVEPNGELQSPIRFDFNSNYNFSIEWKDFEKMDCSKVYNNNLEIDMIISLLEQFYKSMTGAMAYSVLDLGRFDYNRMNNKIELVMEKLGIERANNNKGNGSNSYFNKNGQGATSPQNSNRGRSASTTMDDLENMMDD